MSDLQTGLIMAHNEYSKSNEVLCPVEVSSTLFKGAWVFLRDLRTLGSGPTDKKRTRALCLVSEYLRMNELFAQIPLSVQAVWCLRAIIDPSGLRFMMMEMDCVHWCDAPCYSLWCNSVHVIMLLSLSVKSSKILCRIDQDSPSD